MNRLFVAQVSKPAVSPISKSAELANRLRVWKLAIQQTWKLFLFGMVPAVSVPGR
jgi:hypothetical protein